MFDHEPVVKSRRRRSPTAVAVSPTMSTVDTVVDDSEDWSPAFINVDDQPLLDGERELRRKRKTRCRPNVSLVVVLVLLIFFMLTTAVLCIVSADHHQPLQSNYAVYRHAAVAADAAPCSVVGRDILQENGSAVDAAIAALFCLGVHDAHSMGIGGGFHMVIYDTPHGESEKQMLAIDARETAPASATPNMFPNHTGTYSGGISVAVPGEVAGYYEAWKRFGRLPWRRLLQPTIEMCRRGYQVQRSLANAISIKESIIREIPSLREQFVKSDGSMYHEGDVMYCKKLAKTLDIIASDHGIWNLYHGSLARDVVHDLHDIGANITMSDLSNYHVRVYPALSMSLHSGHVVHTLRPPSSGVLLAFMLRVLEGFNFTASSQDNVDTYQKIVETFKFSYALRTHLGDEMFANVSEVMQNLTSWSFADYIRRRIDVNRTHNIDYYHPADSAEPRDHGTSHLSVQSPDGAAVAATSTVNSLFGSLRIGTRTGILFNDEMNDFLSPEPLSYANRLEPGKRPQSSMCPAVVVDRHGDVVMVIGGSGGPRITSATAYVAAHKMFLEFPMQEAVDVPRLHHQLVPNELLHEHNFDERLVEGLEKKGHVVVDSTMHAVVQAIFDKCKPSSTSVGENVLPRQTSDDDDDDDELCVVAVSDYRKHGAPSGF